MAEIVVGIDGSEVSLNAARWAAREAVLREQPLRVVHALQTWLYGMPPGVAHANVGEWARTESRRMLEEASDLIRAEFPTLAVSTQVLSGDARPALLDASAHASLIVVGGRGEGGFTGLLLGSVAHALTNATTVPVVVVQSPPVAPVGEIVVGADGSAKATAALVAAFAEAALRQVPLRVVYAWRPTNWLNREAGPSSLESAFSGPHLSVKDAKDALTALVDEWSTRYPSVKVIEELQQGHPVSALIRASANADLLVVGKRGRGGLAALRLGSVSHGVLHHAPCPVMVVPAS